VIFLSICYNAPWVALLLRKPRVTAIGLHGQMRLEIPPVDSVINYDIPTHSMDYIHRVGQNSGAMTMVVDRVEEDQQFTTNEVKEQKGKRWKVTLNCGGHNVGCVRVSESSLC
uniref:Helicase C-terminal domain-containing protein n=1 Tax=Esox lucius TaxID=8010 RepID=A0A6Q2ZLG4_ESOLU